MLKKQFIAFLFASVLLANLGHNIVPHHHHIDSILSHQRCHENDEDNSAFHTGDPSNHCHAFNGIEYYPAPEKQDISKPFKTAKYNCLSQVIELIQPIPQKKFYRPLRGSPAAFTNLLGSSIGLRAPPIAC
jgi:hypothetical protein